MTDRQRPELRSCCDILRLVSKLFLTPNPGIGRICSRVQKPTAGSSAKHIAGQRDYFTPILHSIHEDFMAAFRRAQRTIA